MLLLAAGVVGLATAVVFVHPLLSEGAGLDLGQDLLHGLAGLVGDHPGAALVIAPLRGVADAVAHVVEAALVHEVHDELQLVQALEVGDLRLIPGLHQGLEAGLHQLADAAAEHRLLTEEVGFRFLGEGGLQHAGAGAANSLGVGESIGQGLAAGILVHGYQRGHAGALHENFTHPVAGGLGRNHGNVHIVGRGDEAKADVEAVGEHEGVAGLQVGRDVLLVHLALDGIRDHHHDHVGFFGCVGHAEHPQTVGFRLGPALAALVQAHAHVHAAVLQVQGMGVTLAAVPNHCYLLVLEIGQVSIVLVVNRCHDVPSCEY